MSPVYKMSRIVFSRRPKINVTVPTETRGCRNSYESFPCRTLEIYFCRRRRIRGLSVDLRTEFIPLLCFILSVGQIKTHSRLLSFQQVNFYKAWASKSAEGIHGGFNRGFSVNCFQTLLKS